jgi:hypothetical protein
VLHGRAKEEVCRLLMVKAFRKQPDGSQVISAWKREKEMRSVTFRMMVLKVMS